MKSQEDKKGRLARAGSQAGRDSLARNGGNKK
jgi:hypothetical protein